MQRVPFVCGNWKMHKTVSESIALVNALSSRLTDTSVEIGVAPAHTSLYAVKKALADDRIRLVAQNVHEAPRGAFTGEVSMEMLLDVGCDYVLVGHSERRHIFGESDELVAQKVRTVLAGGLRVILALGETLDERKQGSTLMTVRRQLTSGLEGLSEDELAKVVLAYEPVWAIGTGLSASPDQAQEVHRALRTQISDGWGSEASTKLRIQYGGSIKPANAQALFSQLDIDGGLVGGASLLAEDFADICEAALT
ncbi:MAG: triose-phosphate isomerase [Myxococcales bacterium]|nr:triose-phosphate isomerase [Myxococcales bacterium]